MRVASCLSAIAIALTTLAPECAALQQQPTSAQPQHSATAQSPQPPADAPQMRGRVPERELLQNGILRVDWNDADGTLRVTDLRNNQQWGQAWLEKDNALKQRIVSIEADRGEMQLECGYPGIRSNGRPAVAVARVALRLAPGKADLELTVHCDAEPGWRQVSNPYVFVRDGAQVSNLFPHCEGMLVPVRKEDPDWIALPDGDFYGGVHSYLMCLGLVDESNGTGLLTLLPDIESTLLKWREVESDGRTVVAPQLVCRANKGVFDRPWRFTYCFSPEGGYVSLAARYRAFFAAQGLHKTLRQKAAENPAVLEILGAPVFWANTRTPALAAQMAESLHAAGIPRCLFAMCNVPLHRPEVPDWEQQMAEAIGKVRALGYHSYRYDQYRDAFEPDPSKSHSHQINTDAWPDKLVHRADGARVAAFGPQSGIVCAQFLMPLALRTFDREFRDFAYSARFLDCLGSVGFNAEAECHDPAHPCDRYFTRQQRTALLAEVCKRGKLAATECGIDYLLPNLHWVEGTTTLVRWKEFFPSQPSLENAGINEQSGMKGADTAKALATLPETAKAPLSVSNGVRYRVPFYALCHHDEVISTWRWEDGMDDPPVYWRIKNLWSVLSGSPPMYRTTADRIAKYREAITRTQRYVSDWAREVALDAMVNHRFVTPDRLVQETEFSSGRGVVVNFGEKDFTLPEGEVVKAMEFVRFERLGEGRIWQKAPCPNVFAQE